MEKNRIQEIYTVMDTGGPQQAFGMLTSSKELHVFADGYNWDDGPDLLKELIFRKDCDLGTACLIFWRSAPTTYLDKEYSPGEPEKPWVDLLEAIIDNVNRGFYSNLIIRFDPSGDEEAECPIVAPELKIEIPEQLMKPTPGEPLAELDAFHDESFDEFEELFERLSEEEKKQI